MTKFIKKLFILPLFALVLVAIYGMSAKPSVLATASSKVAVPVKAESVTTVDMNELVEYLLEGSFEVAGLPSAEDSVWTIVNLKSDTLFESYKKAQLSISFNEYLATDAAKLRQEKIREEQEALKEKILKICPDAKFEYSYSAVTNGFGACIKYGEYAAVARLDGVKSVDISVTYETEARDDYDTNVIDVSTLAGAKSNSSYRGQGMVVGILDTGLLTSHEAFSVDPEVQKFTLDYLEEVYEETYIYYATGGMLSAEDTYVSGKVPFAFDYADGDTDVNPSDFDEMFEYGNEHGTHVAGIAAGNNGMGFEGAAPDAQLAIFKVFGDSSSGASAMDIVAALNDALVLGVDSVNLSLGAPCGFDYDVDDTPYFDALVDAGIIVCNSAGNAYNSNIGTTYAYGTVLNPDQGTVSSAATYDSALAVASYATENQKEPAIILGGVACIFNEALITQEPEVRGQFVEQLVGDAADVEYEWVYGGTGTQAEIAQIDAAGKIVLVLRGGNTFAEKAYWCEQAGAVACVIMNNVGGVRISPVIENADFPVTIPVCTISLDDGLKVRESTDTSAHVGSEIYKLGGTLSEFSSWGPTPTLKLKPEITTYGGYVYSALANETGSDYAMMSGTSMASPNMAGNMAVLKQALIDKFYGELYSMSGTDFSSLQFDFLMSTATLLVDDTNGVYYSPRRQGAGLINIDAAIQTEAYLSVPGQLKPKIELGDDKDRDGVYKLVFTVNNIDNVDKTFAINPIVLTTTVQADGLQLDKTATRIEDCDFLYSVRGAGLLFGNELTVEAGKSATVTVVVTLSEEEKELLDASYPFGTYVEGFVEVLPEADEPELSLPFLAFYGDWDEAPIMDFDPDVEASSSLAYDSQVYFVYGGSSSLPAGEFWFNTSFPAPEKQDNYAINPKGALYGIYSVYVGLLRNSSYLTYSIYDKATGTELSTKYGTDIRKGHIVNGNYQPVAHGLDWEIDLPNNTELELVIRAELPGGNNEVNYHNELRYTFMIDYEVPYLYNSELNAAQYAGLEPLPEEDVAYIVYEDGAYYLEFTACDNGYLYAYNFYIPYRGSYASFYGMVPFDAAPKGTAQTVRIPFSEFAPYVQSNTFRLSIYDSALNGVTYTFDLRLFPVQSVDYVEDAISIEIGQTVDPEIELYPDFGYFDDVAFESSDDTIVEVSDEGLVTGLAEGTATVTVSLTVDGEVLTDTIVVNVHPHVDPEPDPEPDPDPDPEPDPSAYIPVEEILLEEEYFILKEGETAVINATTLPENATEPVLMFYSSDEDVAIVDADGVITAVAEGVVEIYVFADDAYAVCEVYVIHVNDGFMIVDGEVIGYTGDSYSAVLPPEVHTIPSYAFEGDTTLLQLYIPSTVKLVCEDALADSSIMSVIFEPNASVELEEYAFYYLPNLLEMVLPEGIIELPEGLLYGCQNLAYLTLPSTLKEIGDYALSYIGVEGEFEIPESVAYLGLNALSGNYGVTKYIIGSQLRYLKGVNTSTAAYDLIASSYSFSCGPFDDSASLLEFEVSPKNKYLTAVDGVLYTKDMSMLICYPLGRDDASFVVPEGVKRICAGAFAYSAIEDVTIASTVKAIGDGAFFNAPISHVKFLGAVAPTLEAGYSQSIYVYYCNFAKRLAVGSGTAVYLGAEIEYPEDSFGYDGRVYRMFFVLEDVNATDDILAVESVTAEQVDEGVKLSIVDSGLGVSYYVFRSLYGSDYELLGVYTNVTEIIDADAKAVNSLYEYVLYPVYFGYEDDSFGEVQYVSITRTGDISAELAALIENIKKVVEEPTSANAKLLKSVVAEYNALSKEDKAIVGIEEQLYAVYDDYLTANAFNIELAQETKPNTFDASYARYAYFKAAYEALTDAQKEFVTVGKILAGWDADIKAAQSFIRQVQFFGEVTLESGDALSALEASYKALTPYQKNIVQATYDSGLAKLQTEYAALLAVAHADEVARNVETVTNLLKALPSTLVVSDQSLYEAAKAAYEALTPEEKALIDSELIAKLDSLSVQKVSKGCTITLGSVFVSAISALGLAAIFFKKRNY